MSQVHTIAHAFGLAPSAIDEIILSLRAGQCPDDIEGLVIDWSEETPDNCLLSDAQNIRNYGVQHDMITSEELNELDNTGDTSFSNIDQEKLRIMERTK